MTREENVQWLTERLTELGFHKTNMDIYLDGCYGLDVIPYFQRDRIGDDEMSYELQIKPDKQGIYQPEKYTATLLSTHPILHGMYAGIDTWELEQRMKQTDWKNFTQWNVSDTHNSKIINDVFQLLTSDSRYGKDIARRLELRYWLHTPMEQKVNILSHIGDYQKKFDFELSGGLTDITTREAYNLLSGRGVLMPDLNSNKPDVHIWDWKVLENGELKTVPNYDLKSELEKLPLPDLKDFLKGPQLIYDLIIGDRVPVKMEKDGKMEIVLMEADPKAQSVRLYSQVMTELNVAAFQLNDVQKHLFDKKVSPPDTAAKPKQIKKRKGRSL